MRLEIILKPEQKKFLLPINYNYPLSSVIYKIFEAAGKNFSEWLHSKGFTIDEGKRFKFFNFSKLFFNKLKVDGNTILGEGNVKFYLSSPIEESLITNFVNGLLEIHKFYLGTASCGTNFKITKISKIQPPKFDTDMKFVMLSPTVASKQTQDGHIKYMFPGDPETSAILENNLRNKYKALFNRNYDQFLSIQFDYEYIEKVGGVENTTKLITIKEGNMDEIKVRGFITPLRIIGDVEIIKLAYYSGIGEKNSLGFGAIDIVKKRNKQ